MEKKRALITGATSGIGRATAVRFAKEGWDLIITGRRADRLTSLKSELEASGASVISLVFDVRNRVETEAAIATLTGKWTAIDLLVNNAGLAVGLEHIDEGFTDDWERMIDTNLKGLLWVTRSVTRFMVARNRGHIVNIGSIAGKEVYEKGNVYCATKFAVDALSKGMRIDLLDHNIKVTSVAPGMVETEFSLVRFKGDSEKAAVPYKGLKPLTGDDVADIIFYCATLPDHVTINDIVVMPTAQASATHVCRR